jgi:hypothetical protein
MAEIMPQLAHAVQTPLPTESSDFLMESRFRYV